MADDPAWHAWSASVNAQLKRLHERTRRTEHGIAALVHLRAKDKGLPSPFVETPTGLKVAPKPRHRVKAERGASW